MLQKIIDYIAKIFGIKREKEEDKGKPPDDIYPVY